MGKMDQHFVTDEVTVGYRLFCLKGLNHQNKASWANSAVVNIQVNGWAIFKKTARGFKVPVLKESLVAVF